MAWYFEEYVEKKHLMQDFAVSLYLSWLEELLCFLLMLPVINFETNRFGN
jgi:hypothetical protein